MLVNITIKANDRAILDDISVCAAKYWSAKTITGNVMTLNYIYERESKIHDDVDANQVELLGGEIISIN